MESLIIRKNGLKIKPQPDSTIIIADGDTTIHIQLGDKSLINLSNSKGEVFAGSLETLAKKIYR